MLHNEHLLPKIGFDTIEIEPSIVVEVRTVSNMNARPLPTPLSQVNSHGAPAQAVEERPAHLSKPPSNLELKFQICEAPVGSSLRGSDADERMRCLVNTLLPSSARRIASVSAPTV